MIDHQVNGDLMGQLLTSLFFLLGFLVTTYVAKIKNFFSLPFSKYSGTAINGVDVISSITFFILSFFIGGYLIARFGFHENFSPVLVLAITQSISLIINITLIYIYAKSRSSFSPKTLIKDPLFPGKGSISSDVLQGIKALGLSLFPLFCIMFLFDAILTFKGIDPPRAQDAVLFLINAAKDNIAIYPAIFAVVVAAPCIEEFLFRGVIQTFFRKKYGSKNAIVFASFLFSAFHYSSGQGFGNIFILLSLFILSIYLGLVYEKTRSLYAPVTLHVTFNLINTIIIILYNIET